MRLPLLGELRREESEARRTLAPCLDRAIQPRGRNIFILAIDGGRFNHSTGG
jgi:hypothetical protein